MKKIAYFALLLTIQTASICSSPIFESHSEIFKKDLEVSVTTSAELIDAIEDAALNLQHTTKIIIHGELIGNFEIPATIHEIILVGSGSDAALNANNSGAAVLADYGAKVALHNLRITGGNISSGKGLFDNGYGIINQGDLEISNCTIDDNAPGGIWNTGKVDIERSSLDDNDSTGLFNDYGSANIEKTSITSHSSYGILTNGGEVSIKKSSISNNGTYGIYNYYGALTSIRKSEINENAGVGLYNEYSSKITVKDSDIKRNTTYGIFSTGAFVQVDDCSISENLSFGINNAEYANIKVRDSKINSNAGGIYNDNGVITLYECDINNNSVNTSAGGVHNTSDGIATLKKCNLKGNSSQTNGGAIYNGYQMTIDHSKIENNTSLGAGGGIYNDTLISSGVETSTLIILDSNIEDNTAQQDGGGVFNRGSTTLLSTEVKGNSGLHGGGIANENTGLLSVTKSTITQNTATAVGASGGGIYHTGSSFLFEESHVFNNTPDQIAP